MACVHTNNYSVLYITREYALIVCIHCHISNRVYSHISFGMYVLSILEDPEITIEMTGNEIFKISCPNNNKHFTFTSTEITDDNEKNDILLEMDKYSPLIFK